MLKSAKIYFRHILETCFSRENGQNPTQILANMAEIGQKYLYFDHNSSGSASRTLRFGFPYLKFLTPTIRLMCSDLKYSVAISRYRVEKQTDRQKHDRSLTYRWTTFGARRVSREYSADHQRCSSILSTRRY